MTLLRNWVTGLCPQLYKHKRQPEGNLWIAWEATEHVLRSNLLVSNIQSSLSQNTPCAGGQSTSARHVEIACSLPRQDLVNFWQLWHCISFMRLNPCCNVAKALLIRTHLELFSGCFVALWFLVHNCLGGVRGSVVVKALYYKPQGRGYDTR
jgi:hypothetical protein